MTEISEIEPVRFKAARSDLLTAEQMASFVCDGFVILDGIVPGDYNEAVCQELAGMENIGFNYWSSSPLIREIFALPAVSGAVASMCGEYPVYDHSFVHLAPAGRRHAQDWHADSILDTRMLAFDLQSFYYPQDTTEEMGATLVLPGSHLRRVKSGALGQYKNIVGQRRLACRAGTVVLMHHGIWHCGQPNRTEQSRYLFKIRLRPGTEQRGLFNTDGHDRPEVVDRLYDATQPWYGAERGVERMRQAKLWRYLVGDDSVDVSPERALTRLAL